MFAMGGNVKITKQKIYKIRIARVVTTISNNILKVMKSISRNIRVMYIDNRDMTTTIGDLGKQNSTSFYYSGGESSEKGISFFLIKVITPPAA